MALGWFVANLEGESENVGLKYNSSEKMSYYDKYIPLYIYTCINISFTVFFKQVNTISSV